MREVPRRTAYSRQTWVCAHHEHCRVVATADLVWRLTRESRPFLPWIAGFGGVMGCGYDTWRALTLEKDDFVVPVSRLDAANEPTRVPSRHRGVKGTFARIRDQGRTVVPPGKPGAVFFSGLGETLYAVDDREGHLFAARIEVLLAPEKARLVVVPVLWMPKNGAKKAVLVIEIDPGRTRVVWTLNPLERQTELVAPAPPQPPAGFWEFRLRWHVEAA